MPLLLWLLLCFSVVLPCRAIQFGDYDSDVAALLWEYLHQGELLATDKPTQMALRNNGADTLVDFEQGTITVVADSRDQLKQGIVQIILTQFDPTEIDAQTVEDFGLVRKNQKPFFYNQIRDHDGQPIEFAWRAERYADRLMTKLGWRNGRPQVRIPLVAEHTQIAGSKYLSLARQAGQRHGISVPLMMAIMETESAFNPLARSRSNALGLMQIKANTAGRDYFALIKGYQHTPSASYLYQPAQNIETAAGYLKILKTRYLKGIWNATKLEYAMIASYNGGAGNLWNSLDRRGNKTNAIARINKMTEKEFYWFLTNRHNRDETRNYVRKVTSRQGKYR
ncbi:murein transglycosylase domain-containing protein [Ferrimonas senticii]|uniref:murein transglycosylase domain-containing protein n=1 Tax=Ferrimonas senticii TaxID=394566 RepID=UPI001F0A1806|nr:murein transglycosylase domain-containing protein [Ferrimonas senticii]